MTKRISHFSLMSVVLCYVGALVWVYKYELAPIWSYQGLVYKPLDITFSFIAGILALIPILWLPKALARPSQIVLWLLYLFVVIPSCVIPYFVLDMDWSKLLSWMGAIVATFGVMFWCSRFSIITPLPIKMTSQSFWVIVASLSFIYYFMIVSVFGIRTNLVALADIYSVRDAYKDELIESGRGVAYALLWQANVINPLLICQGLTKRIPLLFFVGMCGQMFLFSITGLKSLVLSIPLLTIAVITLQYQSKRFSLFVVWGAVFLIAVCAFLDIRSHTVFFSSLIVRRLIVVPGQLGAYYFEFFSSHPLFFLQHSIFGAFVEHTYALPPALTIGQAYFGDSTMNANANVWADAFSNFGFLGMFIYAIILGFILQVLDKVAESKDLRTSILLMVMPSISLSNSALLTSLLTHGMGLAILLIYLLPKSEAHTDAATSGLTDQKRKIDPERNFLGHSKAHLIQK